MATAIDSSVFLNVPLADPIHGQASEAALRQEASRGGLIINEVVIAEITPVRAGEPIQRLLSDGQIKFVPSSLESAILAGKMLRLYLQRGGKRGRVAPDFLIAAHAQLLAGSLLARDRGYYRDYFKDLELHDPSVQN